MKKFNYPPKSTWSDLAARPEFDIKAQLQMVETIFSEVAKNGNQAVKYFTHKFDKVTLDEMIQTIEIEKIDIDVKLKSAIETAYKNIYLFHEKQVTKKEIIETMPGVRCWREARAIQKVGLYIPGGSAPLFSTVLMLGIPAQIAGCSEVVLCTPPQKDGTIHPAILFAASLCGITKVYSIGGIQAIAAMSLGTETIPKVDKLFGPGNSFVTAAKMYAQSKGIAIDMPAGPSEVLVIADRSCVPAFVAADLLSQAEHGPDSQVILLSDEEEIINEVLNQISLQKEALPRLEITDKALMNSKAILLKDVSECLEFSNIYAPEHLILAMKETSNLLLKIENAGSVFVGNYSCESAGDYASGTNHTLPTSGFARSYSGVSLDSFFEKNHFSGNK